MSPMSPAGQRASVLVAADGAAWEATALSQLASGGVVVLRRCVDTHDLMAAAAAGSAEVALVDGRLPGLDADCVVHLLRYDVRTVAVVSDPAEADRLRRIGVGDVVEVGAVETVADAVRRVAAASSVPDPDPVGVPWSPLSTDELAGRVVAVWGPTGAPGRTTVALGIAGERARAGHGTVLLDLDQYGGTVAQHLGVLDEVSGLLAAARLANQGTLDGESFARCRRRVAPGFEVLTGLPRADRWVEVRAGVLDQLVSAAAGVGDVVLDSGFGLEDDQLGVPVGRNRLAVDAVGLADEVVVVGTAEPPGLTRLAHALVELAAVVPDARVRVVVNRMRGSLGWRERDVRAMVEGFVRPVGVHFIPEDRGSVDRALVAGASLSESGDSPLRRAFTTLSASVFASPVPVA